MKLIQLIDGRIQLPAELRNCGELENRACRNRPTEERRDAGRNHQCLQRMAAEFKKSVMDSNPGLSCHRLPDLGDRAFLLIARRDIVLPIGQFESAKFVDRRQHEPFPVKLPVCREWQFSHKDELCGNHVLG